MAAVLVVILLLTLIPALLTLVPFLVFTGAWELVSDRPTWPDADHPRRLGAVKLVTAILLGTGPWVTGWFAERRNNWVDADDDGLLDPFVSGNYDWMDVNGGTFALSWAIFTYGLLALMLTAAFALQRRLTDAEFEDEDDIEDGVEYLLLEDGTTLIITDDEPDAWEYVDADEAEEDGWEYEDLDEFDSADEFDAADDWEYR